MHGECEFEKITDLFGRSRKERLEEVDTQRQRLNERKKINNGTENLKQNQGRNEVAKGMKHGRRQTIQRESTRK